jgi:hypothetical protein
LIALLILATARLPVEAAKPQLATRTAIVQVGSQTMTLQVTVAHRDLHRSRGPIEVTVQLPTGASGAVLSSDGGFSGRGWAIRFASGAGAAGTATFSIAGKSNYSFLEVAVSTSSGWGAVAPARANTPVSITYYL